MPVPWWGDQTASEVTRFLFTCGLKDEAEIATRIDQGFKLKEARPSTHLPLKSGAQRSKALHIWELNAAYPLPSKASAHSRR
mmetsp:Transcript_15906/g.45463  ORF Transcript_15906/g.45463 Transcript_15906/m.45463 type:complete len:82 (-) Transcript_15906:176-421(-)